MNARGLHSAGGLQIILTLFFGLATAASIQAQIYSVNMVGYADVDFVAGSNLVANPFNAGNNTVSNLFRGVPDGTMFIRGNRGPELRFEPTNQYSAVSGW